MNILAYLPMTFGLDHAAMLLGYVYFPYVGWALLGFTEEDLGITIAKVYEVFATLIALTTLLGCGVLGIALLA